MRSRKQWVFFLLWIGIKYLKSLTIDPQYTVLTKVSENDADILRYGKSNRMKL